MSEPNLISPLLDGFAVGNPISEHNGIRCCPAIKEHTDKKYILKIISIPASQVQMDAMILAGAFRDEAGAMDYYQDQGKGLLKEAELLQKLSRLDGFLSYEGWQMEPIPRYRLGYEIYLLGSYKRSLDKYMRHNAVTHLEAINLGLDMCAALSVARQAGYLYVDLKPSNIFMSDKKEYRIGDLGFIDMKELHYSTLPDRYHSAYTAPELYDPMVSVNTTVDTYALGMLLYQLYNDGHLPFKGKAPAEALPSPVQADYELAEIILKAIHPDPEQRWADPGEMGKALASYMQRNSINDVPITPLRITMSRRKKEKKQKESVRTPEAAASAAGMENTDQTETAIISPETLQAEPEVMEENAASPAEESPDEMVAIISRAVEESTKEEPDEFAPLDFDNLSATEPEMPEAEEAETEAEAVVSEKTAVEELLTDDADEAEESEEAPDTPCEDEEVPEETELSEELSRIIAQADDLIAHEPPEGVVLPEIPELPDPFAFATEDEEEPDDSDVPYDPLMDEEETDSRKKKKGKKFIDPKYKRGFKRFLSAIMILVILAVLALAAFWYYQNCYLQTINAITIDGDQDQITVSVDTTADQSLLAVTCIDHYGNVMEEKLHNGQAVFDGLQPNTMYTIQLEIEGFHDLVGKTSDIFTTDATTSIVSFTSIAGAEDGSVMLSFTVDGEDPDLWTVHYSAEGEEPQSKTFTGHSVSISNLTVGKVYTFTLDAGAQRSLSGSKSLELMATRLILAENLTVTSSGEGDMTVRWDAPGDIIVDSWDVRCYNDMGYEETVTATETEVLFTGIDFTREYTIEVTASGMTQPARAGITANPINISDFQIDESEPDELKITWEHSGESPEDGWLLLYSIDGSDNYVVKSAKTEAAVSPRIPGGKYSFSLQAADGTSIFNNQHSFTASEAESFEEHGLSVDMLTINLVKTPEDKDWHYENIKDEDLTNTFQAGDKVSIVLRSSDSFYLPGYQTKILFVIRDSYGNVLANHSEEKTVVWKDIWMGGDAKNGELDIPSVPANPGSFTLNLYIDGMEVAEIPFTITE